MANLEPDVARVREVKVELALVVEAPELLLRDAVVDAAGTAGADAGDAVGAIQAFFGLRRPRHGPISCRMVTSSFCAKCAVAM